jgi:hypothetical protein
MMMPKSRRIRWAGHTACMGEIRNAHKTLLGNIKGRDHREIYGRIILKCI